MRFLLLLAFAGSWLGCGDDDTVDPDGSVVCLDDTQCDDGVFCNGVERCMPASTEASALGCVSGSPACLSGQSCDEAMSRCVTLCDGITDADSDGVDAVECGGDDCDDADPNTYPGNTELCDDLGHDEDCNPSTFGSRDLDRDGFHSQRCCNGDVCGTDCDDTRSTTHQLSVESCDGFDNDCDGTVDEEVSVDGFVDADGDGWGDAARAMRACSGSAGFSSQSGDCDDDEPQSNPGLVEVTDTLDNDCDASIDEDAVGVFWYPDQDMDGYGDPAGIPMYASARPAGSWSLLDTDCDDTDAEIRPAAPERCNGVDDDCDGRANAVVGVNDLEDDDGDGVADLACGGTDCDDSDPLTAPGLAERCDGRDNDCDGVTDEEIDPVPLFVDVDGDGFGAGSAVMSCAVTGVFSPLGGDCDDTNALVHPGAAEQCDGVRQDCSQATADVGASCSLPNAAAGCVDGTCRLLACAPGALDCDGDPLDGCEVDYLRDAFNCGRCGNGCGGVPCDGGICQGEVAATWFLFMVDGFWLDPPAFLDATVAVDLPFTPTSSSTGGNYSVSGFGPAPSSTILRFEGADAYPTLIGHLSALTLQFFARPADVLAAETAAGVSQRPDRGIVIFERAHNLRDCALADTIDTFASLDAPRDAMVVGQAHANGAANTEVFYFFNVPPGTLRVTAAPGIAIAAPLPEVRAGFATVVKLVGCPTL